MHTASDRGRDKARDRALPPVPISARAGRMTIGFLHDIQGIFYRAVDAAQADTALAGSRRAGRYSAPDEPTLYLSASREGVAAAMIARCIEDGTAKTVLGFDVT